MTKQMQKKIPIFVLIGLLIICSSIFLTDSEPVNSKETVPSVPTLFIHGFKGNQQSFGSLIERFEKNNWVTKGLSVHVSTEGDLSIQGKIGENQNPVIQVVFANNQASVLEQTEWLNSVMAELASDYHIREINIVAHSMGGLASVSYLLNNQDSPLPQVEKLITIGSPFLGIDRERYAIAAEGSGAYDLQWQSPAVQKLVETSASFDQGTSVLNIIGVVDGTEDESDGLVTLESARGLKQLVPVEMYQEEVFYNPAATHVGLHEFEEVDNAIASFLWNIH